MIQSQTHSHRPLAALTALAAVFAFEHSQAGEAFHAPESRPESRVERLQLAQSDGPGVSFREAGDPGQPTLLILQSAEDRDDAFDHLAPKLQGKFHILAPDHAGRSAETTAAAVSLMLDRRGVASYALYMSDEGADVGYHLFAEAPDRVTGLVIDSPIAQARALDRFWEPIKSYWSQQSGIEATDTRAFLNIQDAKWQFTLGMRSPEATAADDYWYAQFLVEWNKSKEIQLAHFLGAGRNAETLAKWRNILEQVQPPALVIWSDKRPDSKDPDTDFEVPVRNVAFRRSGENEFSLASDNSFVARKMDAFLDRITAR
ncbi:alpha/beta fold hydrolase [Roseibium sp.]|uniref:alpha/beta fold hydrolase n=1 Tax=Roseibium sp. TaxID=1936156 RepID=UPI003A978C74